MQKGTVGGEARIYRDRGEGEAAEALQQQEFAAYATARNLPSAQVELDVGDLYFLYTENVHEVPQVIRERTRVVLAAFFAMSPDEEEIFVWS